MSDQAFWYLSRSAGLIAWLAAGGSILVGVMTPSRLLGRRPTIPWLVDLHRMLAALASVFLVVHLAALWFDSFVQFRLHDLLLPGVATVPGLSRLSLALGVVAAWLMAAVELTSLIRDSMPPALWRTIHLTSYAVFALGSIHAFLAGSDVTNPLIAAVAVSTITAVILATLVRIRRGRRRRRAVAAARDREAAAPVPPRRDTAPTGAGTAVGSPAWADPADDFIADPRWGPPSRYGTTPHSADRPRRRAAGG